MDETCARKDFNKLEMPSDPVGQWFFKLGFDYPLEWKEGVKSTNYYDLYFEKKYCKVVGKVRKHIKHNNSKPRLDDVAVREYIERKGITFERDYDYCIPNKHSSEGAFTAQYKSCAKYDRGQPQLDEVAWQIAGIWTMKHFQPYVGGARVVSCEAAWKNLNKTTSPGWPWNLVFQTKAMMESAGANCVGIIEESWRRLGLPQEFVTFWLTTLKGELRSVEKLKENKIRTFTAGAFENSACTGALCLDFNEKFYASNNKHWGFPGGTKYLRGWDNLFSRLNKHPNAFALDESNFDSSLFRAAMQAQRDRRWACFHSEEKTQENKVRLWNIYDSIINSKMVMFNGEVIQKNTGNPSGSANTIVDNTMILFHLFAYAWVVLQREELCLSSSELDEDVGFSSFMSNVEAALNGDDNTFTVSDKCVGFFNAQSVARVWTTIGVVTKSDEWKSRKLQDVDFLSHYFHSINGLWLPVPERCKVWCSLLRGSKHPDNIKWTLLRLAALRMETWPDKILRDQIADMYLDILQRNQNRMCGSLEFKGATITATNIREMWKTDLELASLYMGHESSNNSRELSWINFLSEVLKYENFGLYLEESGGRIYQ